MKHYKFINKTWGYKRPWITVSHAGDWGFAIEYRPARPFKPYSLRVLLVFVEIVLSVDDVPF